MGPMIDVCEKREGQGFIGLDILPLRMEKMMMMDIAMFTCS